MANARWLHIAILTAHPSVLAFTASASMMRNNEVASRRSLPTTKPIPFSTSCQLLPFVDTPTSSTKSIEFDFLMASNENFERMEHFVSREIGEHVFDCLNLRQAGAATEQIFASERAPHEQVRQREHNNPPSEEWSRIARELGIISLTVLPVLQGTHFSTLSLSSLHFPHNLPSSPTRHPQKHAPISFVQLHNLTILFPVDMLPFPLR